MHGKYDDKFRRKHYSKPSYVPLKKEIIKKFVCKTKINGEILYGIRYQYGACLVGIDAWRSLNPIDSCSYPCKWYKNMDEVLKDMELIKKRNEIYYMEFR